MCLNCKKKKTLWSHCVIKCLLCFHIHHFPHRPLHLLLSSSPHLFFSYLCIHGSVSAQPEDGPTGGRCPEGYYCPEGASIMVACPAGTFSSIKGDPFETIILCDICERRLDKHVFVIVKQHDLHAPKAILVHY